ncbi:MAG: sensor histidine kinase [Chloroflexota bacterium]
MRFERWIVALVAPLVAGLGLRQWMRRLRVGLEEEAMQQVADERSRFIHRLDHELKNPLTAIRVELANLELTEDPERRRALRNNIREQVLRLSHLVGGLRKLSLLETGEFERLPVDMDLVLQGIVVAVRDHPAADMRRLKLPAHSVALPPVMGDEDLLGLAIYNLLDNALKFTSEGDRVTLYAAVEDSELAITVEDTGQGIPQADLPYVWEELYRSKEAHGIPGSGLGLALVRTIIERHEGRVDIRSQQNVGTSVTLYLPLAASS